MFDVLRFFLTRSRDFLRFVEREGFSREDRRTANSLFTLPPPTQHNSFNMSFDVSTAEGLKHLNEFLADKSYLAGYE